MKILLSGLHPDFDPEELKHRMSHFGPVVDMQTVTEGDPDKPWVLVEMAVDPAQATELSRRIDGIYYRDRFIHARVMLHD